MKYCLYLLSLCLFCSAAHADKDFQSIASIHSAVDTFAQQQASQHGPENTEVEVRVGRIDQRLRLTACKQPLSTALKHSNASSSRFTVQVSCASASPWTVYVPVSVKRYGSVAVAKRRLPRDTLITADDVVFVKKELGQLRRGYIQDVSRVIGKKTKRSIQSRALIRDHALIAPSDIHKGEKVVISAHNPMINIRMAGTALDDGVIGEVIKVRNLSSNKIIEAEVIRPGVVQVRM